MIKYIKTKGYKAMSDRIVVGKRVSKWGNGLGVLLPQQVVEKMELKAGDKLVLEIEDLLKDYEGYQKLRDFEFSKNQEVNREVWKDTKPVGEEVW